MPKYRAGKFLLGPDERFFPLVDTTIGMREVMRTRGGKAYLVTDEENLTKLQTREHASGGVSCAEYLRANGVQIITANTLIDQTFPVGSARAAKKAYNTLRDHPEKFPAAMQSDFAKTIFIQGPIGQERGSVNIGADLDVVFNPNFAALPASPQAILSEGYAMAGSSHVVFQRVPQLSSEDQKELRNDPELRESWEGYKKFIESGRDDFAMRARSVDVENNRELAARDRGRPVPSRNLKGRRPTESSEYLVALSGSLPLDESIRNFNEFLANRLLRDSKDPGELVSAGLRILCLNFHKKQPSLGTLVTAEYNPLQRSDKASIAPEVLGIEGRFNTQTWKGDYGDKGGFLFSKTIKTMDELEYHATEILKVLKEYLSYEGTPENRTFQMIMHHSGMDVGAVAVGHDAPEEKTKSYAEQAAILAAAGLTGLSQTAAMAALGGTDRPQLGSGAGADAVDEGVGALTIAAAAVAGAAVIAGGAYLARKYLGGGGAEPPPAPRPERADAAPAAGGRGGGRKRR
jgi:hypothetical protein